jgi:hypothetical protein
VRALLASRTQAQPAWSRKAIQSELCRLGVECSLRSVQRYVNKIRNDARPVIVAQTAGDTIND